METEEVKSTTDETVVTVSPEQKEMMELLDIPEQTKHLADREELKWQTTGPSSDEAYRKMEQERMLSKEELTDDEEFKSDEFTDFEEQQINGLLEKFMISDMQYRTETTRRKIEKMKRKFGQRLLDIVRIKSDDTKTSELIKLNSLFEEEHEMAMKQRSFKIQQLAIEKRNEREDMIAKVPKVNYRAMEPLKMVMWKSML